MRLTAELAARTYRQIADSGPIPDVPHFTEAEYDAVADAALAAGPGESDLWLFAYGSLIWRPEFATLEQLPARLGGWQRRFPMRVYRYRGTLDDPGLMMGLLPGGHCDGVVQRVAASDAQSRLRQLVRREMSSKPPTNTLTWVEVAVAGRAPLRALAITASPGGRYYCGELPIAETAEVLARACGFWGSGAQYLYETIASLERFGIHDEYLWQLQELVAERIEERNLLG